MIESTINPIEIPPIVVLFGFNRNRLATYTQQFETDGYWVAATNTRGEALDVVRELRPDIIVADLDDRVALDDATFISELKSRSETPDVPVVVVMNRGSAGVSHQLRDEASVCLTQPPAPDTLTACVRRVLDKSAALRNRSKALFSRAEGPKTKSERLITPKPGDRACPECGRTLAWSERTDLAGALYDYFDWCESGCGLYCLQVETGRWVRIA